MSARTISQGLTSVNHPHVPPVGRGGHRFGQIDNTCRHHGGPLGEGVLEGHEVICPWHGWRFDVTTGQCGTIPTIKQDVFECVVEGDEVKVKLNG